MVKRYTNTSHGSSKKRRLIVIITLLVIAVISIAALYTYLQTQNGDEKTYKKTSTGHDVNLDPPTKEEKQEAEQHKDDLAQEKDPEATPTPANVKKPFITFAGQEGSVIEVAGYITGIFEEGGTCKATFTKGSLRITGESKGFEDADHTTCTPIAVSRDQFAAGTWSVTLSYSSSSATGTSDARNIVIQ